ncbi:MAG: Ig-like domain-containing protein [Flavobacteriaceae bacterium]
MKGKFLYLIFILLLSLSFVDCAKRGNPEGGLRDSIPPVIVRSAPENYSTNFDSDEIRIYFDEYIKLKDLQQQLIISPPLENAPVITPFSTSKYIKIVFTDTLKENTTYSINFGNSIVDNNEENPFEFYKYVFSTGTYIDSLKVLGTVSDALKPLSEEAVTVMLYEVDENFTDSTIYNKKPYYVSNTLRSPEFFSVENIKPGKYLLIGLKDNNNNYMFEPKTDKIGFVDAYIDIPTDTTFHLNLFKEIPAFNMSRPSLQNSQKVLFGYEGRADSINIEILSQTPQDFEYKITKDPERDSLYYWFKPRIESDSLLFKVTNNSFSDTLSVRMKDDQVDSLSISAVKTGTIAFDETLELIVNTPIASVEEEKMKLINKDSLTLDFQISLDERTNVLRVDFDKAEREIYTFTIFPGAVTDFFGQSNDTLSYKVNTRTTADYGFLSFNIESAKSYPLIVQLVTERGIVTKEMYAKEEQTVFEFENIPPANYNVRVIYDTNANGIWDTGDFLKRRQPEEVVYFPTLLEVRANWTLNETFILE